jgi:2-polyprenyl-6-methoxyphenol hydroxylase-like FAD-dependent oxidoreductase
MQASQVIVVGGGPVGLCTALLLADAGVNVILLEADAGPSDDPRGSTFHPPTLDMLDRIDVAYDLIADGLVCPDWQTRLHPTGTRAVFDLECLKGETNHPFRLQCEQWKLSRILRKRLADKAQIVFGAKVIDVAQDDGAVTVTVEQSGARHQRRCEYLVGCDGMRSAVRAAVELPFEGTTYPETTLLTATTFPFERYLEGLSNVSYCWQEDAENFTLLRVPDRWRVSIYPRSDVPLEDQTTPKALEERLRLIVPEAQAFDLLENRPYRVHMRIVPTYRAGRVALAGDAAHVNSPTGGMGLNGGLHDAFELAEALIAILCNGEDDKRLDLYDRRRMPIARDEMLAQADRNRRRMRERDPVRRRELLAELQAIADDPVRRKAHLMRTSMIDGLRRAKEIA